MKYVLVVYLLWYCCLFVCCCPGNDPTTDLRGCGMLGLLTTLHFITSSKTSALAQLVYHLSVDELQHFPFCVMSINVTRIAMQALRTGKLNKYVRVLLCDLILQIFEKVWFQKPNLSFKHIFLLIILLITRVKGSLWHRCLQLCQGVIHVLP